MLDLSKQRFGRLIAVEPARTIKGALGWKCDCDCGRSLVVETCCLTRRIPTMSCGCSRAGKKSGLKYGKFGTKVYRAWSDMKSRCLRESHQEFGRYGGRGISVCREWLKFESFYAYVGDPPSPEHSIERQNVNGNYEPGNVVWATQEEQDNNKRNTVRIVAFGETKSVAQWSRDSRCAVGINTLRSRIRRGYDPERAIAGRGASYARA